MITIARSLGVFLLSLAVTLSGCSSPEPETKKPEQSGLPDSLFLEAAPEGARPLAEVKPDAKVGETVTFVARVGGRKEPFAQKMAVLMIADPSMPTCDELHGDTCPTPWDYCCEERTSLLENTATVQIVNADGRPVSVALEDDDRIKPLDTVTVVGTVAQKSEDGVLVVNATGIFVKR